MQTFRPPAENSIPRHFGSVRVLCCKSQKVGAACNNNPMYVTIGLCALTDVMNIRKDNFSLCGHGTNTLVITVTVPVLAFTTLCVCTVATTIYIYMYAMDWSGFQRLLWLIACVFQV